MNEHLYAVILAGGSGTRFWPLSRELYPKQFLKLLGDKTMLQRTLLCAKRFAPDGRLFIVTHRRQTDAVKMQAGAVASFPPEQLIAEPSARNTAAAVGLAALRLMRENPEAVMAVLPADHVIRKEAVFSKAVRSAAGLARKGWLVTFGVKPDQPETGYGYIRRGRALGRGLPGYRVGRFVEKPDRATAKRYLSDGAYFWNSGIFVWRARDILEAIRQTQPGLYKELEIIRASLGGPGEEKTIEEAYARIKPVSIDSGVLERKAGAIAMIPAAMGWSDVGSWSALDQVSKRDRRGNVMVGNVIDLDSRNSILYADRRVVAAIGLEDLVVVDTEDATLVCRKDRAQDVRRVVEALRKRNAEEHRVHRTVLRPWGSYTVLETGERFKIKRIVVNPGARLSLQMHHRRSEHWVVVAGTARVTCGEKVYDINVNESTYIPIKTRHRLENPGTAPLEIIEVQNGDYLGEDDIVRFQDDYGRG